MAQLQQAGSFAQARGRGARTYLDAIHFPLYQD
jgi:hypothetical protein